MNHILFLSDVQSFHDKPATYWRQMDGSYLKAEDAATTHRVLRRLVARPVLEYGSRKKEANFSRPLHELFESKVGSAEYVL
jgi:hypothetical protein